MPKSPYPWSSVKIKIMFGGVISLLKTHEQKKNMLQKRKNGFIKRELAAIQT